MIVLDVLDMFQSSRHFRGLFPIFNAIIKGRKVDMDLSHVIDPNRLVLGALKLESCWFIVASMLACIERGIASLSNYINLFWDRVDLDQFTGEGVNVSRGVVFDRTLAVVVMVVVVGF